MLTFPFDLDPGEATMIAKALREYRPETSEEEGLILFFAEQLEKLDAKVK